MQEDTRVCDVGTLQWLQREGRCLNRLVEPDLPTQPGVQPGEEKAPQGETL